MTTREMQILLCNPFILSTFLPMLEQTCCETLRRQQCSGQTCKFIGHATAQYFSRRRTTKHNACSLRQNAHGSASCCKSPCQICESTICGLQSSCFIFVRFAITAIAMTRASHPPFQVSVRCWSIKPGGAVAPQALAFLPSQAAPWLHPIQ